MSTETPREYLVSLTFRREEQTETEAFIILVEGNDEEHAYDAAHDRLIFGFGFDDVDPATVQRFAIAAVGR